MIDVEEAMEIFKNNTEDYGTETIPLSKSIGRVLREEWSTDRDLPPYHRVTMDGISLRYEDFAKGTRRFTIENIAAAGDPQKELSSPDSCLEVMTGSILPKGSDTVIRYEDLTVENGVAQVEVAQIVAKQNVHFKGSDRQRGEIVCSVGKIISSAEIGLGASLGKAEVKVAKLPSAIVISTGNELVPIDSKPLPYQIRRSNIYRITTALEALHISCAQAHLDDDEEKIRTALQNYLQEYDLVLLSGGVSKGKFDFIPKVLDDLGAEKLFHKVAQRPGKPFWFGKHKNCKIFAFPGNPVSSFVCMHRYFIDWLGFSLETKLRQPIYASLTKDVSFKPDLTYYLEVVISYSEDGKILATPQKGNGSGDLANLVDADAIMQLPRGKNHYAQGEVHPIYFYR